MTLLFASQTTRAGTPAAPAGGSVIERPVEQPTGSRRLPAAPGGRAARRSSSSRSTRCALFENAIGQSLWTRPRTRVDLDGTVSRRALAEHQRRTCYGTGPPPRELVCGARIARRRQRHSDRCATARAPTHRETASRSRLSGLTGRGLAAAASLPKRAQSLQLKLPVLLVHATRRAVRQSSAAASLPHSNDTVSATCPPACESSMSRPLIEIFAT